MSDLLTGLVGDVIDGVETTGLSHQVMAILLVAEALINLEMRQGEVVGLLAKMSLKTL